MKKYFIILGALFLMDCVKIVDKKEEMSINFPNFADYIPCSDPYISDEDEVEGCEYLDSLAKEQDTLLFMDSVKKLIILHKLYIK